MWQFTMLTLVTLAMFIGNSHASAAQSDNDQSIQPSLYAVSGQAEQSANDLRYTVLRQKVNEGDSGDETGQGNPNLISEIF